MIMMKIAFRNILRNRRRSLMTLLAIAIGGIAIVLFGEFIALIKFALQTDAVENVGHLAVFRKGYFDYGAGNPGAFGISDYEQVIRLIQNDPEIKPKLNVITPSVSLAGIAGNFDIDASKTFIGVGFVPKDRDRMMRWDDYHVYQNRTEVPSGLRDDDESRGSVGVGLARILGLCEQLKLKDCPPRPNPAVTTAGVPDPDVAKLALLAQPDRDTAQVARLDKLPQLDLLAATASGAPNVVTLFISRAEQQNVRELDDNFVAMHFALAQKLLYGRDEHKAVGIILQLHHTKDLLATRLRLDALFKQRNLDLETRDFIERQPFYEQTVGMFNAVFMFLSLIIGIIVLFTVVNTVGMTVMERTNEIGTIRAMGVRRSSVRRLFVIEGMMLGGLGGTAGVIMGQAIAVLFNHAGATWMPPGQAEPIPFNLATSGVEGLLLMTWLGLVLMAAIAAAIPANRAARLKVVDALRHV